MEWMQIVSLFLANTILIVWFREEGKRERKRIEQQLEEMNERNNMVVRAIQSEMEGFNARLLKIEDEKLRRITEAMKEPKKRGKNGTQK